MSKDKEINKSFLRPPHEHYLFHYTNEVVKNSEVRKILSSISHVVEEKMKSFPFNATLNLNKKLNDLSIKLEFSRNGESEIIKTNPKYESIIYYIDIYYNNVSKEFKLDTNKIILLRGGVNDNKKGIGIVTDNLILNKYVGKLNCMAEEVQNDLLKSYGYCLKKL